MAENTEAPKVVTAATTSNVIVMCSLPHGLTCRVKGKRFTLKGAAHYLIPNPDRKFKGTPQEEMILQTSMNLVDRELWEAFVEQQNRLYPEGFPPFVPCEIFGPAGNPAPAITWTKGEKRADAVTLAKDFEGHTTGFEQIDPKRVRDVEPATIKGRTERSPVISMGNRG